MSLKVVHSKLRKIHPLQDAWERFEQRWDDREEKKIQKEQEGKKKVKSKTP